MLLGSDLLLFSNEKYAAVSLHLWDVTRQVVSNNWNLIVFVFLEDFFYCFSPNIAGHTINVA